MSVCYSDEKHTWNIEETSLHWNVLVRNASCNNRSFQIVCMAMRCRDEIRLRSRLAERWHSKSNEKKLAKHISPNTSDMDAGLFDPCFTTSGTLTAHGRQPKNTWTQTVADPVIASGTHSRTGRFSMVLHCSARVSSKEPWFHVPVSNNKGPIPPTPPPLGSPATVVAVCASQVRNLTKTFLRRARENISVQWKQKKSNWLAHRKETLHHHFAPPSLAFAPLLSCPCCLTWMPCLPQHEYAFADCCRRRKSARSWPWASPLQWLAAVVSLLSRPRPLPCAIRWLLGPRRATNGRLVEHRGQTVRATANPISSPGHSLSLQIRVSRGSDSTSRAGVRVRRFCPRRDLLWLSRWPFGKFGTDGSGEGDVPLRVADSSKIPREGSTRSSRTLVSCAAMMTPGCSWRVRGLRCTWAWPPKWLEPSPSWYARRWEPRCTPFPLLPHPDPLRTLTPVSVSLWVCPEL